MRTAKRSSYLPGMGFGRKQANVQLGHLTVAVLAATALASSTAGAASQHGSARGALNGPNTISQPTTGYGVCTMALPAVHATIEVQTANAGDFCELVSQALASDVFRAPVLVTPGRAWHYADAVLSCLLGYGHTRHRLMIRNSAPACRWLTRPRTGWQRLRALGRSSALTGIGPEA